MRYKVIGNRTVAGVEPGGHVNFDKNLATTRALIKAGHLEAIAEPAKKATKKTTARSGD
jgi:hypothetical protein